MYTYQLLKQLLFYIQMLSHSCLVIPECFEVSQAGLLGLGFQQQKARETSHNADLCSK